ncbi:MAG: hypothetical protein ACI8WB_003069 [Phenylobacterium sp.]|jgi:hypothetical protein
MKNVVKMSVLSLLLTVSNAVLADAECIGEVSKLWTSADDTLYFNIVQSNACVCNFVDNNAKGFSVPANQSNTEEQYSALLAAYMAKTAVNVSFDWAVADGSQRCMSYHIVLGS